MVSLLALFTNLNLDLEAILMVIMNIEIFLYYMTIKYYFYQYFSFILNKKSYSLIFSFCFKTNLPYRKISLFFTHLKTVFGFVIISFIQIKK